MVIGDQAFLRVEIRKVTIVTKVVHLNTGLTIINPSLGFNSLICNESWIFWVTLLITNQMFLFKVL